MKKSSVIVAFMLGVVATLLACIALGIQPPRRAEAQSGVKWEYEFATGPHGFSPVTSKILDTFGQQGWEAVAIDAKGNVLMKRRK